MSDANAQTQSTWIGYAGWGLRILAALVFLAAGGSKLIGAEQMVQVFTDIGVGQWFRYVTGLVEVAGAVLLLAPATVLVGAGLLICTMIGAVIVHLFVIGGSAVPALVLLALCGAIAWMYRRRTAGG